MFHMIGAIIIGALTGYMAERLSLTRNGVIVSVALGVGGAIILWFAQGFMGIGFGLGRAMTSFVGAVGLLFINSMRR